LYIVIGDLNDKISATVVRQILDDDLDGTADPTPVARAIADAESYVEGFLRVAYDLTAIRALGTNVPNEIKRLCLDVCVAFLWERHPEYVRADGAKMLVRVRQELIDLRRGLRRLDIVGTPEPPANRGGVTLSGDEDDPEPRAPFFLDPGSMGDF
jgi:phage gp36-like protein